MADFELTGQLVAVNGGLFLGSNRFIMQSDRTNAASANTGFWGGRLVTSSGPATCGLNVLRGSTRQSSVIVQRLLVVMTQPPRSKIVYEAYSDAVTGEFDFSFLPAGKYVVLDIDPDGVYQALVYDNVVSE